MASSNHEIIDAPVVTDQDQSRRPVSVVLATPLGKNGRGGMGRFADMVIDHIAPDDDAKASVTRLTTKGGDSKFIGFFYFLVAVVRLILMLITNQVDVLHINLAAYGSFYRKYVLAWLARRFGVPYVVHIHTGRFGKFWGEAGERVKQSIDRFMRDSASIIVLGRIYEELIDKHAPECKHKVEILPNATPTKPHRSDETAHLQPGDHRAANAEKRPLQITFLGDLVAMKGIPQLVEALGQLKDRKDWKATLAGDGDIAITRKRIEELGLGEEISLPGWLESDQVDELLSQTDIFVLPSFSEGLPMSILEAFAWGIAVVATPVNAVADVVLQDHNGLLVEPGDADGLAAALTTLLDDDNLRRRLGETARADHAKQYATDPYLARLTDIWQKAATP